MIVVHVSRAANVRCPAAEEPAVVRARGGMIRHVVCCACATCAPRFIHAPCARQDSCVCDFGSLALSSDISSVWTLILNRFAVLESSQWALHAYVKIKFWKYFRVGSNDEIRSLSWSDDHLWNDFQREEREHGGETSERDVFIRVT